MRNMGRLIVLFAYMLFMVHACFAKQIPTYQFLTYAYPPYSYLLHGEPRGPGYAMVAHICQAMHVRCNITMVGRQEAIWQARRGRADVVFFVAGDSTQRQWLYLSPPVMTAYFGLYTRHELQLHYAGPRDLRVVPWRIGSQKNADSWYYFTRLMAEAPSDTQQVLFSDPVLALTALQKKHINAVYIDRAQGAWLAHHEHMEDLRFAGYDHKHMLYFGFPKRRVSADFQAAFSAKLLEMQATPRFRRILAKHGITQR